ncbi:MAG: hypothetical protein HC783_14380 [Rhodobacteraceae bacterium]|nr:hypothetical protein [Paracoccaceae bacterium]
MRYSVLWVVLLGSPALAQDACQIAASAKTAAFAKVPIHAAPVSTSEVLDVAPSYQAEGGAVLGARFMIAEVRGGWARVTGVTDWSGAVQGPDGWIGGLNIVLLPQTNRGFAVASAGSKVVWEGNEWPVADGLSDCKGEWGKVRLQGADGAGAVTAWVRGFCDDQSAACEGVTGD